MQRFNVGIIGAGAIVESSHLPVLKTLPDVEVKWIYDITDKRKQLLADMYNIATINETDLEEAMGAVDICLLTIPFGARPAYIKMIALAGKALYVEKPFALTLETHQEYCNLFRPHQLAIGYQRREYSLVSQLESVISSGIFGTLKEIRFTQGHFTLKGGKGYLSDANLSGGGVIIESAIHSLDQLLLISKAERVQVNHVKSLSENGIDYDSDFSSTIFTGKGRVETGCRVSALRNLDNGIQLYFDNAIVHSTTDPSPVIKVTDHKGSNIHFNFSPIRGKAGSASTAVTVPQSFVFFWRRFIAALRDQQVNLTSAESSLLTTAWVEQLYNHIRG